MKKIIRKKKKHLNNRGSALVLTMIVLVNALLIVSAITIISAQERKITGKTRYTTSAYQAADSGIEWALGQIKEHADDPTPPTTLQGYFGNFSGKSKDCGFGVDCTIYFIDDSGDLMNGSDSIADLQNIRSVGKSGPPGEETTRAVQIRYGSSAP